MFLELVLLARRDDGEFDYSFLGLGSKHSIFGPISLHAVLDLENFSPDEVKVNTLEIGIEGHQIHDFTERSVAEVDCMFQVEDNLNRVMFTSCAENLAWMISWLESWS